MLKVDSTEEYNVVEVSPLEAWKTLSEDSKAQLIDVRTIPEWSFVGIPDLSSLEKSLIRLSWCVYPTMEKNKRFLQQLEEEVGSDKDCKLFFICRSGARSYDAAQEAINAGYKYCYNITDGFEGNVDSNRHRGTISGWKKESLAWIQG
jgi:rhodanese-related sulfurtransferase